MLLTTQGAVRLPEFSFEAGDTLLLGQESTGVPDHVHARAEARLFIPISPKARSMNVITAGAVALGEALRQTRMFPI